MVEIGLAVLKRSSTHLRLIHWTITRLERRQWHQSVNRSVLLLGLVFLNIIFYYFAMIISNAYFFRDFL